MLTGLRYGIENELIGYYPIIRVIVQFSEARFFYGEKKNVRKPLRLSRTSN